METANGEVQTLDCGKAHDMIQYSWISECLKLFGEAEKPKKFLANNTNKWKLESTSIGVFLGNVEIWTGIFQGDSLSPLLFVLCIVALRKVKFHCEFGDKLTRLNHLLLMDDLELFAKSHDQIDSVMNTVNKFSEDIEMEFRMKKCGF